MALKYRFPLVSLIALGIAMPAMAQQAAGPQTPAEPQAEQQDRDVVVVTANKREESVQDIAVAVTAITDTMRDEIGLATVQDYTNFAPGLTYSTSDDRIGMRGVTRSTNNFGIRSGITNYVDGIYYSSSIPGSREPIFVDRVEVVRGPQGTLYGRDSIGGALNVVSKRPTEEFEGQFNIGMGNYDTMKVEGTVAGPINDGLRYRLGAARSATNKGYFTNYAGGETEGGRSDSYFLEAQLEGNIGERFDWWTRASTLHWDKLGAPGARTSGSNDAAYDTRIAPPNTFTPNAAYGFTRPHTQVGSQTTNPGLTDAYGFNTDDVAEASLPQEQEFALEAVYHADNFDIKYLGGYVYYKYNLTQDDDGTPVTSFVNDVPGLNLAVGASVDPSTASSYTENRAWFSNEINILSTGDGPFNWIAGLYAYQENYAQPTVAYLKTAPPGPTIRASNFSLVDNARFNGGAPYLSTKNSAVNDSFGAFFQGDYQINDAFKFTGGIRYSYDDVQMREDGRLLCYYVCTPLIASVDITDIGFNGIYTDPVTGNVVPTPGVVGATTLNPSGATTDPVTGVRTRNMADVWDAVTGTLGLDWKPSNDTLVYGKYSRGYKSGGFGAADVYTNFVPSVRVDQETVDAYELGWKQDFRGIKLTSNAALFFYDYSGYQVPNEVIPANPALPSYTAFLNIPKIQTLGFELETTWSPTPAFQLLANYAYTDAKFTESAPYPLINGNDPFALLPGAQPLGPATASGQGQTIDGNLVPFVPKNKVAVNGMYTWDFSTGSLTASASYYWQDVQYNSIFTNFTTQTPEWDQVDARLLWNDPDGKYTFILYARNLLDELQYDSASYRRRTGDDNTVGFQSCGSSPATSVNNSVPGGFLAESCYAYGFTPRPPRTYGAELQFHF